MRILSAIGVSILAFFELCLTGKATFSERLAGMK